MNPVSEIVWKAAMQGKPVWSSQLRAVTDNPAQFAAAVKSAERNGVEVKGYFSYQESQALLKAAGSVR